jgi:hypothetical protein
MSSLHRQAFGGLAILILVMASLLFVAAGTLDYWPPGRSWRSISPRRSRSRFI